MVGKSKKRPGSRPYKNFSNDTLVQAVQDCKNGLSYRKVAEKYGISKSTLQRKIVKKHCQPVGRPTVLSEDDEHNLREGIISACKWGFPLGGFDIRCIVKAYLDKKGIKEKRFKNNLPGLDWFKGFMYRHREYLSERMAENIKRSRATICTSTITTYFEELKLSLAGITPDCIINYNETNITDDPGRKKIVARRGCRHPERIMDSSKSSVSVMFAGTASGYLLPPYIVYKAENMYNGWTENGPKGARYNRSKSGWFDGRIFEDWFLFTVLPYFKKQGPKPKALIGDNLASHLSLHVISECEKNNIKFILLPPNSTHLCQPLDVAFFRPLKRGWRESLTNWKAKNRGCIPKTEFPRILKKTLDKLGENNTSSQNLISGFKASGIFPLDSNKVLQKLPDFQLVTKTSINNSETSWVQSFEEFLSDNRMKETTTERKMRKKKLMSYQAEV